MRSIVLLALAALCAFGAHVIIYRGTNGTTSIVGGAIAAVGLPLMVLSRRQLGSSFATTPQAKALVTQGLYAKIPHPMYLFLDIALLGVIVLIRQEWALIPWAALIGLQVWQARRESKVLEQAYGDAYRDYRKRTLW